MDYAAPIPHVFRLESPRLTPFTIQWNQVVFTSYHSLITREVNLSARPI
jgi:hypothetical protein